jgi:hypothetical protein
MSTYRRDDRAFRAAMSKLGPAKDLRKVGKQDYDDRAAELAEYVDIPRRNVLGLLWRVSAALATAGVLVWVTVYLCR